MYLNKILFPAPNSHYDAKTYEKELIWITRNRYQKDFKIDRKENSKPDKKKKLHLLNANKFIGLFKNSKQVKNTSKDPQSLNALNLETSSKRIPSITKLDNGILVQRNRQEKEDTPPMTLNEVLQPKKENSFSSMPKFQTPKKLSEEGIEEVKKEDDKSKKKKKKNKAACLSFLPKMHKDKKITLEMFDGSHEVPHALQFGVGPALRNLGPEIADAIIHRNKPQIDIYKESSSDSEDEPVNNLKKTVNIPCLYIKSRNRTQKTILYFHGNGEDLSSSYEFLQNLSHNLFINIVAVEYPGYGIYSGSATEKKILLDAETVYNYLINELKIEEEDIFLFGRSIGSGPATWLASVKSPGMLILMAPFTSIRAVAKHLVGSLAKFLVKERFKNSNFIHNVRCPVFIIHGKKDTLIPVSQATKLYDLVQSKKQIYIGEEMTHSDFDFFGDVTAPLTKWLKELNLMNSRPTEQESTQPKSTLLSNSGLFDKQVPFHITERHKSE